MKKYLSILLITFVFIKQFAGSSTVPVFPLLYCQKHVTGEHDGHMGNHGVIGDRAAFFPQPQAGLAHLEEHFDAPAFPIQPHDLFLAQFHVRRNWLAWS